MQKLWQKNLGLHYSKSVIDIVQFGSTTEERKKPNDIDIAVIFKPIPLKQQLEEAQLIKKQLGGKSNLPIHINSFTMESLFDESNFAKENILFSGMSLLLQKPFVHRMGFSPQVQIGYVLKGLAKKEKIKCNYLLNGKGGKYGLLREYKGSLVKPGLIEIPPFAENIFVEELKKITSALTVQRILVSL